MLAYKKNNTTEGVGDSIALIKDTTFVKILVEGKHPLYYGISKHGLEQFFIQTDTGVTWLRNYVYVTTPFKVNFMEQIQLVQCTDYIQQLYAYFNLHLDLRQVPVLALKTPYTKIDIIRFIETQSLKLNLESNKIVTFTKIENHLFIAFGVDKTQLLFTARTPNHLSLSDYPYSIQPTAGITYSAVFPDYLQRFSVQNTLLYGTYKTEGNTSIILSENERSTEITKIGMSHIKLYTGLQYRCWPQNPHGLSFQVGLSNARGFWRTN